MPLAALSAGLELLIQLLGPVIVQKTKRAVEEAAGKFTSDWRRQRYVRKELRRAIHQEARIARVPRSVQRFLVELLVLQKRGASGLPLVELKPPLA